MQISTTEVIVMNTFDNLSFCRSKTGCVCETQMPSIMTNSKDGQVHKDKYLDTSTKILSQEMIICNMKSLIFIILL